MVTAEQAITEAQMAVETIGDDDLKNDLVIRILAHRIELMSSILDRAQYINAQLISESWATNWQADQCE